MRPVLRVVRPHTVAWTLSSRTGRSRGLALAASSSSSSSNGANSTVNAAEIEHFSKLSAHWWDESGEFGMLHKMNPVRAKFIRDRVVRTIEDEGHPHATSFTPSLGRPLQGLSAVDIGCGGGLLSETLARMGAQTLAVDASSSNIQIALAHAKKDPYLTPRIPTLPPPLAYRHGTSDDLVNEEKTFDIVTSMEVVEHVDNPASFIRSCAALVKPGGHLFLSTLSRTPLSYFLTIFMAENVLKLVTPGTHHWHKYINPEELSDLFRNDLGWLPKHGHAPSSMAETRGMFFNPLTSQWSLIPRDAPGSLEVNYLFWIRKPLSVH